MVAKLESALQAHSLPPPIPPKGLPPSPPRGTQSTDGFIHTPQPPKHRPPLPYTPQPQAQPYDQGCTTPPFRQPFRQLQNQACSTPQPPRHPPPELSHGSPSTQPPHRPPPELLQGPPTRSQTSRLPSSAINKVSLIPVASIIHCNADNIAKEGRMGTIEVALARDSFFGEDVMAQCTPRGYGDKPGLPLDELMLLKEEVRKLYPNYWNNPVVFEEKWSKCLEAIGQACKRIRHKNAKKTRQ